jgi:hypothetical protein
MRTALEYLFAGLRNFRAVAPDSARHLRLHFIGTSYAGTRAEPSVLPIAQACGVPELVREETGRVGYFTAIATLLAADAVIIPGSDDTAYNPSKIAGSFLSGKPTLALTPAGSALDRRVSELGFATVARWPAPEGVTGVTDFLRERVDPSRASPPVAPNWKLFAATHTARARTRQQCELFDLALATGK